MKPYREFFYAIKSFDNKQLTVKVFDNWKGFTLKSTTLRDRYQIIANVSRKKAKILELWYSKALNKKLIANALHLIFAMTSKFISVTFMINLKKIFSEERNQEEKCNKIDLYYDQKLKLKSFKALEIIWKKSEDQKRRSEFSLLVYKSNLLNKCIITLNAYKTIRHQKKEANRRIKDYSIHTSTRM